METQLGQGEPFWRKNLLLVCITQFVTYVGFSLCVPFAPFFFRDKLGVSDEAELKSLAALSSAIPSVTLALIAPLWGILSDRFGRKIMMLRANLVGGVIFALMGCCYPIGMFCINHHMTWITPPVVFLILRAIQGLFTGTTSSAMTLVAGCTPDKRQGFAMSMISASMFSGEIGGYMIGGYMVELLGYERSFYLGGGMWFLAGLAILFFVQENFHPKAKQDKCTDATKAPSSFATVVLPALPLLLIYILSNMGRFIDSSQFPLIVEAANGGPSFANTKQWTGLILASGFVGAMVCTLVQSAFIDRYYKLLCLVNCLTTALLMVVFAFVIQMPTGEHFRLSIPGLPDSATHAILILVGLRILFVFFSAGLEPIWNSWLSRLTPPENKGLMFGAAVTFRSLGSVLAHGTAGFLAIRMGFPSIYVAATVIFLAILPLAFITMRRLSYKINA